jgi:hypothetical protein
MQKPTQLALPHRLKRVDIQTPTLHHVEKMVEKWWRNSGIIMEK